MADDAGALLVRSGLVSAGALDDARARVDKVGGTIGEQLVATGVVSDEALTDFYRQRLLVPMVNPNLLARLPAKVVAVIPSDLAVELRAVPVSLDADNNLTVAMSDPSDRHAVDEIAFFTGAYVVRAVATQMQIAWCLAHYYGHVTPLGTRLIRGGDAQAEPTPSAPKPRTRGHTAKVNAARHKVLAPVTNQVEIQRPTGDGLDDPTPGPVSPATITPPPLRADDNGVPDVPRARTASGEIRLPRAPSIKPPVPDDASGPIITIEVAEEDLTGPRKVAPKRRTPARTDPPELAARAGEVSMTRMPVQKMIDDAPSIMISDELETPTAVLSRRGQLELEGPTAVIARRDDVEVPTTMVARPEDADAPVVIHSQYDCESAPILLERKRPSQPPLDDTVRSIDVDTQAGAAAADPPARPPSLGDDGDDTDVVVLDAPKGKQRPRPEKRTQIGMGAVAAATAMTDGTGSRMHRDTEADGLPAIVDDAPTMQMDAAVLPDATATAVDRVAASTIHRADSDNDDNDEVAPPPPPMAAAATPAPARSIQHDAVDDGWGERPITVPPPLLGAMPGTVEPPPGAPAAPQVDAEAAPLVAAAPTPPSEADVGSGPTASGGHALVRELEDATARAIDLIRRLDHARDRDEVVNIMVDHLASTHRRAGFFSIRPLSQPAGASLTGVARGATELALFSMRPAIASIPSATLRLDRPSTLEDVVGTRLPYRGPMHDDASRTFLAQMLGSCPPEILLVPVAIRERVVGVLFGEHRVRHSFDDQLALAARAAGISLERILAKKKT